jgi:hypothetical protein
MGGFHFAGKFFFHEAHILNSPARVLAHFSPLELRLRHNASTQ